MCKQRVPEPLTLIWISYYYYLPSIENVLDCTLYHLNILWELIVQKNKLFLIMQCNHFDNVSVMSISVPIQRRLQVCISDICFTAAWIKLFISSSNPYIIRVSNFHLQHHFQQLSFSQCCGSHNVDLGYFRSSKSGMTSLLNILESLFKLTVVSFADISVNVSEWDSLCHLMIQCTDNY